MRAVPPIDAAGSAQDRARAARILVEVLHEGRTTDQAFGSAQSAMRARPLIQELVYGTLRHYYGLTKLLDRHLERALRSKDLDLRCLMLVGAYQLHHTRIPAYAAINETVSACGALRKPWARGLVNGVLRAVSKQKPGERRFDLPEWLESEIRTAYPEDAEQVLAATLERAPMCIRVNRARIRPAEYLARLEAAGISAQRGWLDESLVLDRPQPTRSLPGFDDGLVSVQDSGAMLAATLFDDADTGARVLDACAAPGGKLFHLAERLPHLDLAGLEIRGNRVAAMKQEAKRLGHDQLDLLEGDACARDWFDGRAFDAILLDAPCSGSGTLRRHPDIKVLRQPADIPRYAALQRSLLGNLWSVLAPGGVLVYCTCSLLPAENDGVVDAFLRAQPEAEVEPVSLPTGRPTRHGWQLLPLPAMGGPDAGPNLTVDGFYFARMTRREKAR